MLPVLINTSGSGIFFVNKLFDTFVSFILSLFFLISFRALIISLFDASTQFSLRIHYQIQNYVKKIKPEYCVLTYEGYSWERMCINGIKKIAGNSTEGMAKFRIEIENDADKNDVFEDVKTAVDRLLIS